MYTITDKSGTRFQFSSIVPAMKKFISAQNAGDFPSMFAEGRKVSFRTSPAAARRAGYNEKQIYEMFADAEVIES